MTVDLAPDDATPVEICLASPASFPPLRLPPGLGALDAAKRRTAHYHALETSSLDIHDAIDFCDWLAAGADSFEADDAEA